MFKKLAVKIILKNALHLWAQSASPNRVHFNFSMGETIEYKENEYVINNFASLYPQYLIPYIIYFHSFNYCDEIQMPIVLQF